MLQVYLTPKWLKNTFGFKTQGLNIYLVGYGLRKDSRNRLQNPQSMNVFSIFNDTRVLFTKLFFYKIIIVLIP